MNNLEMLILKYGEDVQIGRKNFNELLGFLRMKGKIVSTSVDDTIYRTICNMIYNIECSKLDKESCEYRRTQDVLDTIISKDIPVKKNKYRFAVYKFLHCDENVRLYEKYNFSKNDLKKDIYIIIEKNTETIYCNSSKLQLELCVYRGISEDDVKNRRSRYYEHLFYLEALENGWY